MQGSTFIGKFLSYVEIKTKITSVMTFVLVLCYLFFMRQELNWINTLLFFASMLLLDLATTALNNYIDTKTNHQTLIIKRNSALVIFFVLLVLAIVLGVLLALRTDVVVLLIGMLCFAAGILYTYGPVPISRLPLGEVFSGIFYGFFIPFLLIYINMPIGSVIAVKYQASVNRLLLTLDLEILLAIILLSVIPVCVTANIMLANNICDLEKDVAVKRHTLPYYLGDKALLLFSLIYYATYVSNILMVVFGILNPITLIALLTFPLVYGNITKFKKLQDKDTTFNLSIMNFVIIMGANILAIFIGALLKGGV